MGSGLFAKERGKYEKTTLKIDENASNETIEEWDSLGHLSILSALDDLTDGKASELDGLADSLSFDDLIKTLSTAGLISS